MQRTADQPPNLVEHRGRAVGGSARAAAAPMPEGLLPESRQRFGFDSVGDPIGKALIGLDGAYLRANPAMCRITGYSERQLLGMTIAENTHADDLADDRSAMQRLLAGDVDTYCLDKRYRTASGQRVWVTKSVSLARDHDGSPLHFVAQLQNINARKGQELDLLKERRRLTVARAVGRLGSWEMYDARLRICADLRYDLGSSRST